MAIKSEELKDGQPVARARGAGIHWDRIPLVIIGWLLLGLWWAAGARYTIDGLPLVGNAILHFFHAAPLFGPVTDWHMYLWFGWLPIFISFIEQRNRPWNAHTFGVLYAYATLIWVIVFALDAASTWMAVTTPQPDDWIISRQVAALPLVALAWTMLTTALPEVGIVKLWRYLRR